MVGDGEGSGRFVVSLPGKCSFCGKQRDEVEALAAVADRLGRICNECLSLSRDIVHEELHKAEAAAPSRGESKRGSHEGPTEYELLMQAEKAGDIDFLVDHFLKHIDPSPDPEVVRDMFEHLYKKAPARSCSVSPAEAPSALVCSFCDAQRHEVKKLIRGARVAICDRCVHDASADVLNHLRTR